MLIYRENNIVNKKTYFMCLHFQVIKPCLPCINACSKYDCSIDCKSDGYNLTDFTIKDIELDASFNNTLYITGNW
jgi:hypothetical protein